MEVVDSIVLFQWPDKMPNSISTNRLEASNDVGCTYQYLYGLTLGHFPSYRFFFLRADTVNNLCFNRKLFGYGGDDQDDPNQYYHYLWNDIVGTFVWFLAAGVATACGVGGGGIYVPLGILLLQFAPKPASGLSQASIFGASLGGLLINIRAKHPNKKIRDFPCQRDADDNIVLPPEEDDEDEDEEPDAEYVANRAFSLRYSMHTGVKYYTRPLIDYDMALFLAPMEMAGAVLGKLIQAILPNWLYLMIASVILGFTSYKTYKKFFATRAKEKEEVAKKKAKEEAKKKKALEVGSSHIGTVDITAENLDESPSGSADADEAEADEDGEKDEAAEAAVDNEEKEIIEDVKMLDEHKQRIQLLEEDARQYPREKLLALLILWIGLIIITFLKGGKGVDSLVGITCESPWFGVLIALQFLWTLGFAALYAYKLLKRKKLKDAVRYPYQPHDVIWDSQKIRFYSSFTFMAGVVAGVAIMFVTSGLVPWSYAVFFFCVCLCGALVGKKYIDGYVKKTGKASLLICILATIIGLATAGCLIIVFTRLAANNWCFASFNKFCYVSKDSDGSCAGERMVRRLMEVYSN